MRLTLHKQSRKNNLIQLPGTHLAYQNRLTFDYDCKQSTNRIVQFTIGTIVVIDMLIYGMHRLMHGIRLRNASRVRWQHSRHGAVCYLWLSMVSASLNGRDLTQPYITNWHRCTMAGQKIRTVYYWFQAPKYCFKQIRHCNINTLGWQHAQPPITCLVKGWF